MAEPMNEERFWDSTPRLRHVRAFARAKQAGPWAALGCVLARVSANVPPNIVIPAYVGAWQGSLNCYVALVGKSGGGKGLADGVGEALVPLATGIKTQPASGESIPSLFARRVIDEGETKGRPTYHLECWNHSALLDVTEISTLGAAMSRQGSTLLGTLTAAWSGETLGARNKNDADTLEAPRYGYRLSLIAGVQPENARILEREAATGLPQRFLWFDVLDRECPDADRLPAPPAGEFGFDPERFKPYRPTPIDLNGLYQHGSANAYRDENGTPLYMLHELTYPDTARLWLKQDGVNRLRDTRAEDMDGHTPALLLTVAGLLALMEQRDELLTVTEDDWRRAQYIVQRSQQYRTQALADGRRGRRRASAQTKADDRLADVQAAELIEAEYLGRAKRSVVNQLERHDPKREGLAGSHIRQLLGRNGPRAYRALTELYTEGKVDKIGPDDMETSATLWALAVTPPQ
ncbi:hypothetical protein [Bifidobacterium pullorum]|uniref:hypothetical protein n=1 Tax=Bifidobacterium pullorum TaxID=78448 RepID=UPI002943BB5C|nr:hypothetical protein [Bifidobacterium pullorum]